ncbi:hypothetical protein [Mycolicibacterium sp.]|uniref:hypothetical protein n=1 Tax=Mycolicibacterium sp. TaxID=2320850 RepID=UPI001A2E0674|nr:hypothetical protein [Mycolicibacterium sp.]MBJ7336055.1 hypothetical protein [Mycolicibacterium sp.]
MSDEAVGHGAARRSATESLALAVIDDQTIGEHIWLAVVDAIEQARDEGDLMDRMAELLDGSEELQICWERLAADFSPDQRGDITPGRGPSKEWFWWRCPDTQCATKAVPGTRTHPYRIPVCAEHGPLVGPFQHRE